MQIHDLPLEVWYRICSYACEDDGATGVSLGQVSRYVRNACRLSHLHSVAIRGGYRLRKFADALDNLPSEHRRIQHLFVSEPYDVATGAHRLTHFEAPTSLLDWVELYENFVYSRFDGTTGREARQLLYDAGWFENAQPDFETTRIEGFWVALTRVLRVAAPQLVTLTIDTGRIWPLLLTYVDFPNLGELTLMGTFIRECDPQRSHREKTRTLPSLRRLHLVGCFRYFPAFLQRAPALTHLRLSEVDNLTGLDVPLLRTLVVVGSHIPHGESLKGAADSFPNLQHFLLHISARVDTEAQCQLWNSIAKDGNIQLSPNSTFAYDLKRAKRHWLERVIGDPGCWQDREQFSVHVRHDRSQETQTGTHHAMQPEAWRRLLPGYIFGVAILIMLHLQHWQRR